MSEASNQDSLNSLDSFIGFDITHSPKTMFCNLILLVRTQNEDNENFEKSGFYGSRKNFLII
jgi:hypothetical protein